MADNGSCHSTGISESPSVYPRESYSWLSTPAIPAANAKHVFKLALQPLQLCFSSSWAPLSITGLWPKSYLSYRFPPSCNNLNKICDIQKVMGSRFHIPLLQLPYSCWNSGMKLCMETLLRIFFFMEEEKMPGMLRIQIRTRRAPTPYTCYQ